MSEQQVDNILEKLSEDTLLNQIIGINHDGDLLHVFYKTFTLLHYESLVEFCAEEELFFYSAPNKDLFQLTLLNDPVYNNQ
ncbi:hypothetical protein [Emticicia fontis]